MANSEVSDRIKVVRLPNRGVYDRDEIYSLLDTHFGYKGLVLCEN